MNTETPVGVDVLGHNSKAALDYDVTSNECHSVPLGTLGSVTECKTLMLLLLPIKLIMGTT